MSKKNDKKKKKNKDQKAQESKLNANRTWLTPKIIRWGIVTFLSILIVFISLFWMPADLNYEITERYTFTPDEAGEVTLIVLLPTNGDYQEVFEPEVTWPGSWGSQPEGRLNQLNFSHDFESEEQFTAEITYRVHLWQGVARWHGQPVSPEDFAPTELILSDHPEIIAQAEQLEVSGNEVRTAQRIFRFTSQHLRWPQGDRLDIDLDALTALQSGVGGCSEHAALMVALSRAVNIPAKMVNGLALPETIPGIPQKETWNHPAGAHAWVEIFVDHTWQFADPSWAKPFFVRNLFGWTDGKHLVYDEMCVESEVYQALVSEAEENGTWIAAMSAPLRFVAWSDISVDGMVLIPEVTLLKVWDTRYLFMFSTILILVILTWITGNRKRT